MMIVNSMIVAAVDRSNKLLADVLPWLIVLVGIVIAGGVAALLVRRSMRRDHSSSDGFTLQDLRDLHAAGELTDQEFEQAKAMMIGRLTAPKSTPRTSKPESSPGNQGQS
jgi:hypothetical protein